MCFTLKRRKRDRPACQINIHNCMWFSIKTNDLRNAPYNFAGLLFIWFILFCATLDYAFHFPEKGVKDVVKISQMPRSLTAFTVCLWMKSSNPRGTLVSYAVSNTENELLVEYNSYFFFYINGTKRWSKYLWRKYGKI